MPGPLWLQATGDVAEDAGSRTLIERLVELHRAGGDWAHEARAAGIAVDGERLLLEVRLQPHASRQAGDALARAFGLRIRGQSVPTLMDAWVPIGVLTALGQNADVATVRPARRVRIVSSERPGRVSAKIGGVDSEGIAGSGLAPYHALGVDGTGTVLALVDGGFDGWSALQASNDWPSGARLRRFVVEGTTVYECPGPAQCSNFDAPANGTHGASTVEIAHDLAPGATYWIYQTTYISEWAAALDHASDTAQHAGLRADVISASLGAPLDGIGDGSACPPTWGSPCGTVAEAAELARSRGSLVVNAAGNEREDHWGGLYNGAGGSPAAAYPDSHRWPSGGNLSRSPYCLPAGYPIGISAHWNDWVGWPTYNYDLRLYEQGGGGAWNFVAASTYLQNGTAGQTPQEYLAFTSSTGKSQSCSSGRNYAMLVARRTGTSAANPRNLQIFTNIGIMNAADRIFARSLGFPADSPAVFTVAALDAVGSYDQQSYFSSEGPVLAPGGGLPPPADFPKPDGGNFSWVSTQTDGAGGAVGLGFGGTSAATPHVAGIAAVLAQMRLEKAVLTAANPAEALHKGLARVGLDGDNDLGTAGHDTQHGYGRIRLRPCSESVSFTANQWHMVGLPCDARVGNTIAATYGTLGFGTYGTDWAIWSWNATTSTYQRLPANAPLDLGEGYWLYSLNPGSGSFSGLVADLTEAWAMPTTGSAGLGRPHLLSSPRRFALDWDDVRFHYDGAEHDFLTAYNDGKVRSTMWRWNSASGDYDVFNGLLAEGQITPGDAFWLRTLADVQVRFPTTATPSALSRAAAIGEGKNRGYGWSIDVSLDASDGSRSTVRLGHDPGAVDGFDGLDAERLGAPSSRPYAMVIPRPELGVYAADYVRDVRAPKRSEEWRMEIRSQRAGVVVLNWDAPQDVLASGNLVDVATGKSHRLASLRGRLELQLTPGVREFRWVFKNIGKSTTP